MQKILSNQNLCSQIYQYYVWLHLDLSHWKKVYSYIQIIEEFTMYVNGFKFTLGRIISFWILIYLKFIFMCVWCEVWF